MARIQQLGPLDPIFNIEKSTGAIAIGNSPGATPVSVTIDEQGGQPDPVTAPTVYFDVVFSEAVSGFTGAGVLLSGSAGADTAVVVNSGDDINYVVQVTGMDVTGTVTAIIPAGVAQSIATGAPNYLSTSTDNTVNWQAAMIVGPVASACTVGNHNLVLTAPVERIAGDLLIMLSVGQDGFARTPPAGWSELYESATSAVCKTWIWWKRAIGDATDNASVTTQGCATARIVCLKDVNEAQIISRSVVSDGGGDNQLIAPDIGSLNEDTRILRFYAAGNTPARTPTPPVGLNAGYQDTSGTVTAAMYWETMDVGAAGTETTTWDGTITLGQAVSIAVAPTAPTPTVSYGTFINTSSSPLNLPYPGVQAGDEIFAAVGIAQSGLPATPAGWTLVSSITNTTEGNDMLGVYRKDDPAVGTESGTVAWAGGGASRSCGGMFAIRGASAFQYAAVSSATSSPATLAVPTGSAGIVIHLHHVPGNSGSSPSIVTDDSGMVGLTKALIGNGFSAGLFHKITATEFRYNAASPGDLDAIINSTGGPSSTSTIILGEA